jgi:putative cardiolipin synthase
VQIRLLLDDINVAGRDATIAALDAHRNIEITSTIRSAARACARCSIVTDFSQLNRHATSVQLDGAVTIVGGRKSATSTSTNPDLIFRDRDVVVIGPVVEQVGTMLMRSGTNDGPTQLSPTG